MSFRTQAPELLQQTAAENAERQVDLEEAGAFIFFMEEAGIFNSVPLFLFRIANSHHMA